MKKFGQMLGSALAAFAVIGVFAFIVSVAMKMFEGGAH